MAGNPLQEKYFTNGGTDTAFVPSGAVAAQVIKGTPGRLCRLICTVASTAGITLFDNAAAASGNVLYASPAVVAVGTIIDVQLNAVNGIVAAQGAGGGAFAVGYR